MILALGTVGALRRSARVSALRRDTASKRLVDVTLSAICLLALAPVLAAIALAIRLADGAPVIHWQLRVGHRGRPFWFPKFRSMSVGAEDLHESLREQNDHAGSITFKMRRDPRITRLGRILRTLSLDELPQLWSVLRGDMSLVGPRPPLPCEVDEYTPRQRRRLEVKPGLTCVWQVSGRSRIPFERQVELDIEYIERQSLGLDLALLLKTIPAVVSCRGAY